MPRPKDPDRQRRTRTTPAAIARAERQARALDLRREGRDYRGIAAELGVSLSVAHGLVTAALEAIPAESAEQLRSVDAARTEQLWSVVWPAAQEGDPKAVTAAVRVLERRAKLLGLDVDPEASTGDFRIFLHQSLIPPGARTGPPIPVEGGTIREVLPARS